MKTYRNEIQNMSFAYAISYQGIILHILISLKPNDVVENEFQYCC